MGLSVKYGVILSFFTEFLLFFPCYLSSSERGTLKIFLSFNREATFIAIIKFNSIWSYFSHLIVVLITPYYTMISPFLCQISFYCEMYQAYNTMDIPMGIFKCIFLKINSKFNKHQISTTQLKKLS